MPTWARGRWELLATLSAGLLFAPACGGTSAAGDAALGGASGSGGTASSGGNVETGGRIGASGQTAGSGGAVATGGVRPAGGATGGARPTGGAMATGGVRPTGGTGTGGTMATGGATTTGGTRASGGAASGGTRPAGGGGAAGTAATGGVPGKDADSDAPAGEAGGTDDQYGPWAGGAAYYGSFTHGPPSDPSFFPILVWLQDPATAKQYAEIGINLYVGLWEGPTEGQLAALTSAGMKVACDQNAVGIAHVDDPTIVMWTHQDEPDNAQSDGAGGYGPCIPATQIQSVYESFKAKDKTRPVLLNLGQGVANIPYVGWGSECSKTHPGDYVDYIQGSDIVSFDIYPANSTYAAIEGNLYYVAKGVDNLIAWTGGKKPVWNWIECTGIDDVAAKPTPEQVKAEVWMSIVHGSMGIGYFVHQFNPFSEHALLDDVTMTAAVGAINRQIRELAPVLNTPPIINAGAVTSSDSSVPVDMTIKRMGGATYVFAVAMRGTPTKATFTGLTKLLPFATVQVIGENRSIPLAGNSFQDQFPAWGVHIYKIE